MKKIKQTIFWAFVVVAATACKKEGTLDTLVDTPANGQKSMSEQVADLIQQGDPDAYDRIYGEGRAPITDIRVTPGVFFIGSGGPVDGHCVAHSSICHIEIVWARYITPETDSTLVTEDYHGVYTEQGESELILNDGNATCIQNLKSVDVVFEDNGSTLEYEVLD